MKRRCVIENASLCHEMPQRGDEMSRNCFVDDGDVEGNGR